MNITDIYNAWDSGDTFRLSVLLPPDRTDRDKLVPDVVKHAFGVDSDDPRIGMIGADLAAVPTVTDDAVDSALAAVERLAAILTSEDRVTALATADADADDPADAVVTAARDAVRAILTGRKPRTRTTVDRGDGGIIGRLTAAMVADGIEPGDTFTVAELTSAYRDACAAGNGGMQAAIGAAARAGHTFRVVSGAYHAEGNGLRTNAVVEYVGTAS